MMEWLSSLESSWHTILPVILALLVIAFFCRRVWKKDDYPFYACPSLLTAAELHFYKTLKYSLPPHCMIAPKVRLGDIITCSESDWQNGHGPRISAKHIDFTLCDAESFKVILTIELDDTSHTAPERIQRDKFIEAALQAAGVPLLRIPVAKSYNQKHLEAAIKESLHHERT